MTPEKSTQKGSIWKGKRLRRRKKVNKKELETHKTPDCATEKWLPYSDEEGLEDETGGKIVPIRQETQAEEASA